MKKQLYKIIGLHKSDWFYPYRFTFEGLTGYFEETPEQIVEDTVGGTFCFRKEIKVGMRTFKKITFFAVKVEEI